jgi:ABC-type uncharacterized transport system permease subunit
VTDASTPGPLDRHPIDAATDQLAKLANPPKRLGSNTALLTLGSSVAAVVLALAISGVLLAITGKNPFTAYQAMIDIGLSENKLLETVDRATPLMIAAVAIGFKMNLFNIGVEGQFLFGMFWAAVAGAYVELPKPFHILFCLIVAMAAGAFWASIAAVLKVKRGVNEVISTIMLNAVALGVLDWLFNEYFREDTGGQTLDVRTKRLPDSAHFPNMLSGRVTGFIFVGLLVAVAFWVIVFKSRFGFRLRASGHNAIAAQTAGISANRMIVSALVLSGAIAGLAGMPYLLSEGYSYGPTRPDGYGFTGIAVALLGRNHPVGIVLGALLYGFLDAVAGPLQLQDIPQSIVRVIQGITLLTVVIVNEAVSRWHARRTTERAAAALAVVDASQPTAVPA